MALVLFRGLTLRAALLIACETVLLLGAVWAAAWLRLGSSALPQAVADGLIWKAALAALVTQLALSYGGLYDLRIVADRRVLLERLLQALGATSLVLAVLYWSLPGLVIGQGVFVIAVGFMIALVIGWRLAFEWLARQVGPRERIVLVGTNPACIALARELYERRELGVEIVGFIDVDPERVGTPILNPGVIGTIDDIPAIVRERSVDRVVVSLSDARGRLHMDRLLEMKLRHGVSFDHLASVYEEYTGKIAVENLRPSWLVFSSGFRRTPATRLVKRAFDIGIAAAMFVLALPVMAIVALAVKATSSGPVLYRQQRVGEGGRVFEIYKFRSMRADAEAATGAVWARPDDPRVTPVGRLLRRSRLDELPQLWNVLRGDMSFVGPRPERPEFVARLTEEIPFYGVRHFVRPGLTGWAQVRYAYGASVEDALEKLQYDLFYIKHLSLALDLYILFETVKIVLLQRGH
jgi:sugar transferase (PEP-CTERM system associated)